VANLPSTVSINGSTKVVTWTPPSVNLKLCTHFGEISCGYVSSSATGTWSNTTNSISLSATLTLNSGPVQCPSTLAMSATWAPVRDTTIASPPLVFAQ
jgi:hypothetical protein